MYEQAVEFLPDKMMNLGPIATNVDYDEISDQRCCKESHDSHMGNRKKPDNNVILENGNTQKFTDSSNTYFTLQPPQV